MGQDVGINTRLPKISKSKHKRRDAQTSVGTISVLDKEIAFRHFSEIVLVQKLATLALLAQTPQPMLADQVIEV